MNAFETILVPHAQALPKLDELRRAHKDTGLYPFIIGNARDLEELLDLTEPPRDGGAAIIEQAKATVIQTWLADKNAIAPKSLPKTPIPPQAGFSTLYDVLTRKPKPEIYIGLTQITDSWHLFAKLGFGGWNDCPEPHIHVAMHQYWANLYRSSPVAVTGDIVECHVANPPQANKDVLRLAGEQYAYCYDIVEQGYGSKAKLAASLLSAKVWYFWWD